MSQVELQPDAGFVAPDPRSHVDAGAWLAHWCASQPWRGTTEKIAELARFAGCSPTTIHYAIRGERYLSLANARALVPALRLPADQAEHLYGILELPHLPPRLARARREQLLSVVARTRGVPWGGSGALVQERPTDASIVAALSTAIAAFEDDRPAGARLLRAAVPPLLKTQLDDAGLLAPPAIRLAPRLWRLRAPADADAARAHQGLLAFASEALLRLPARARDYRSLVASVDEEGFRALDELCRWLEGELTRLAEDAEVRKPDAVVTLLTQRFVAAGPFPAGASAGDTGWIPASFQLPPLEAPLEVAPSPSEPPARPHPAGIPWFPTWVRVWRAWAARAGLPCSDAWLAEQTGLSRSSVYDLCTGTTRFSSEHVYRFLKPFGLEQDKPAQAALEGMAMVATPDDPRQQALLIAALRSMGVERGTRNYATEAYFVQSQWYVDVIRQLPDLGGFQALPGWIARTLKGRVDWTAAREALIALGVVGILRRDTQGRTVVTEPNEKVMGPSPAVALYEAHQGRLQLYRAELDNRDPDLTQNSYQLGLPEKGMPRYQRLLDEFHARRLAILMATQSRQQAGAPMDRVVVLSHQSFPVFRLRTTSRRGAGARTNSATPIGGGT